jgi:hypothetical protein
LFSTLIYGHFNKWDPKTQQLERHGKEKVIVKRLENVENVNRSWFEEVCSLNLY